MFYHLKNLILESPFSFKCQWRVTKAAELTFQAMKNMMALPEEERKIVLPVFERAFFYRHPKQLLLNMLEDVDQVVCLEAIDIIMNRGVPEPL
jgi:hypothetical protein